MNGPLMPYIATVFAIAIAAGDADYLAGSNVFTVIVVAAWLVLMAVVSVVRRTARWRLRITVLGLVVIAAGWLSDRADWMSIRRQQVTINYADTNHIATVTSIPARLDKTSRITAQLYDGQDIHLFIPHRLAPDSLLPGQTIIFRSHLRPYDKTYLLRRGILARGYVTVMRVMDTRPPRPLQRVRAWLLNRLHTAGLDARTDGLAGALLVAERGRMDKDTREAFRDSGAAHLLALSGTHLSLLMALLFMLFGRELSNARRNALIISLIVWLYVLMAGAPISLVRAATMHTIFLVVCALNREPYFLDVLWLSLMVILVASPHSLFDVGCQLSFACVFALALCPTNFVPRGKWYSTPTRLFLTSLICTLASSPFTAWHFHTITLYGCVSNLLLIPLTMITIILSTAVIIFPHPLLAYLLNSLVSFELTIAHFFASLPLAVVEV